MSKIKIPRKDSFPMFHLSEEDYEKITQWMQNQPPHVDDNAVNGCARWEYRIIDHGLWSDQRVIDRATGDQFVVDIGDPADW